MMVTETPARGHEVAERLDERTGVRESVRFAGPAGGRLMSVVAEPGAGGSGKAVVVCSSVCNDFLRNYRREVLLARSLAAAGTTVGRFHYRGTGNSDGGAADITFDSMVEDVRFSMADLEDRHHVEVTTLVATRFAAPVAAAALRGRLGMRLVLIDPTIELRRFFREAWRANKVRDLSAADPPGAPVAVAAATDDDPLTHLRSQGWVGVLGFAVHEALFDSSAERRFLDELGEPVAAALWVQLGTRDLPPAESAVVARLREAGAAVQIERLGRAESWWVLDDVGDPVAEQLVTLVTDWVRGT
jgi:alpha/beta superfamily hydrolase